MHLPLSWLAHWSSWVPRSWLALMWLLRKMAKPFSRHAFHQPPSRHCCRKNTTRKLHGGTPAIVVTGALVVKGAEVVSGAAVVTAHVNIGHIARCTSPPPCVDIAVLAHS